MGTPAIRFLKQRRLAFEVVSYTHLKKGAEYAARATGFPLARTVKTLGLGGDRCQDDAAMLLADLHLLAGLQMQFLHDVGRMVATKLEPTLRSAILLMTGPSYIRLYIYYLGTIRPGTAVDLSGYFMLCDIFHT